MLLIVIIIIISILITEGMIISIKEEVMKTIERTLDLSKKLVKNNDLKKKNGIYNTYHGPISQEWIDGRY